MIKYHMFSNAISFFFNNYFQYKYKKISVRVHKVYLNPCHLTPAYKVLSTSRSTYKLATTDFYATL